MRFAVRNLLSNPGFKWDALVLSEQWAALSFILMSVTEGTPSLMGSHDGWNGTGRVSVLVLSVSVGQWGTVLWCSEWGLKIFWHPQDLFGIHEFKSVFKNTRTLNNFIFYLYMCAPAWVYVHHNHTGVMGTWRRCKRPWNFSSQVSPVWMLGIKSREFS